MFIVDITIIGVFLRSTPSIEFRSYICARHNDTSLWIEDSFRVTFFFSLSLSLSLPQTGQISEEDFAGRIEADLHSQHQPSLLPFLKVSIIHVCFIYSEPECTVVFNVSFITT